jgi:hypothetical protein
MEVMAQIDGATLENAMELIEELLDRYGTARVAIMAIKSREVGFEPDQ